VLGAIVEKEVVSQFLENGLVSIVLRSPDFVTASAMQKAIETAFPGISVSSRDASLIEVKMPEDRRSNAVGFLAQLEALTVIPDAAGRVVISAANGVIVMGEKVRIGKVAVSYKSAKVSVGISPRDAIDKPDLFVIGDTTTVDEFVSTLKTVGLKTDVIIGVLQAIEKAGALYGSLLVM
jgi:flagellar P-ring protein precursor FlgI